MKTTFRYGVRQVVSSLQMVMRRSCLPPSKLRRYENRSPAEPQGNEIFNGKQTLKNGDNRLYYVKINILLV